MQWRAVDCCIATSLRLLRRRHRLRAAAVPSETAIGMMAILLLPPTAEIRMICCSHRVRRSDAVSNRLFDYFGIIAYFSTHTQTTLIFGLRRSDAYVSATNQFVGSCFGSFSKKSKRWKYCRHILIFCSPYDCSAIHLLCSHQCRARPSNWPLPICVVTCRRYGRSNNCCFLLFFFF